MQLAVAEFRNVSCNEGICEVKGPPASFSSDAPVKCTVLTTVFALTVLLQSAWAADELVTTVHFNARARVLSMAATVSPARDLNEFQECQLLVYLSRSELAVERAAPIFLRYEINRTVHTRREFEPHPKVAFRFGVICDGNLVALGTTIRPFEGRQAGSTTAGKSSKALRTIFRRLERLDAQGLSTSN